MSQDTEQLSMTLDTLLVLEKLTRNYFQRGKKATKTDYEAIKKALSILDEIRSVSA